MCPRWGSQIIRVISWPQKFSRSNYVGPIMMNITYKERGQAVKKYKEKLWWHNITK